MSKLRPRDIYPHWTRDEVREFLQSVGCKVIGFRPPQAGEVYLGRDAMSHKLLPAVMTRAMAPYYTQNPRLILDRLPQ